MVIGMQPVVPHLIFPFWKSNFLEKGGEREEKKKQASGARHASSSFQGPDTALKAFAPRRLGSRGNVGKSRGQKA